ncbi:MAG: phosphatase PAP2 family protein [Streptococcaceae bacterium]|jgi:undecaprenyl-diphosphatase|nr:phosphatase PAP2 family protein [Streptococcaceae bacterium]
MSKKPFALFGVLFLIFFVGLAAAIRLDFQHSPFYFDNIVMQFAYRFQGNSLIKTLFTIYTQAFGDKGGMITAVVVLLALFIFRQWRGALYFAVLTAAAIALNTFLKSVIGRSRPTGHRLMAESGFSFPSGHSLFAVILLGTLFIIITQHIHNRAGRFFLWLFVSILILLVMASRIYIGVHYPSDTIGALLLGLAFLFLTYPLYYRFAHPKRIGSHVAHH